LYLVWDGISSRESELGRIRSNLPDGMARAWTIYGINFEHMPELSWLFGYPFALLLMVAVRLVLYLVFKQRGWL
jgi:CorA-like Mg2+ transporter protein